MLGWNLYLQIALSTGLEIDLNYVLSYTRFHLYANSKVHFKGKYIIRQQVCDHLVIIHYLKQVAFSIHAPEKKGLTVVQKSLSFTK